MIVAAIVLFLTIAAIVAGVIMGQNARYSAMKEHYQQVIRGEITEQDRIKRERDQLIKDLKAWIEIEASDNRKIARALIQRIDQQTRHLYKK